MTAKDFAIVSLLSVVMPVLTSSYNMTRYGDIQGKPEWGPGLLQTINKDTIFVDSSRYMHSVAGAASQYMRGDGTLAVFPSIPAQFTPQQGDNITITGAPEFCVIKNAAVATDVPFGCLRSYNNSGAVFMFSQGSSSVTSLLSVSVLTGPATNFATTTGLKVSVTVKGY